MLVNYPADTPYQKDLIQHTSDRLGLPVYRNDNKNWFFIDSNGKSLRPIQDGRIYNFSGVEYVSIPNPLTATVYQNGFIIRGGFIWNGIDRHRIIDGSTFTGTLNKNRHFIAITDTGFFQFSIYDDNQISLSVSTRVSENIFYEYEMSVPASVSDGDIIVLKLNDSTYNLTVSTTFSTYTDSFATINIGRYSSGAYGVGKVSKIEYESNSQILVTYNCNETAGLIAFDSSGNNNHGTITLAGSAQTSFHAIDNVPSTHNDFGYNVFKDINTTTTLTGTQQNKRYTISTTFSLTNTLLQYKLKFYVTDATSYVSIRWASDSGTNVGQNIHNSGLTAGQWYTFVVNPKSNWPTTFPTQIRFYTAGGSVPWTITNITVDVDPILAINRSNPTKDILGNNIPLNYLGKVRHDEQIKGSSVGIFDGTLIGSTALAKSITNFIHQTGIFDIEITCSFTNGSSTSAVDTFLSTMWAGDDGIRIAYGNSYPTAAGTIYIVFRQQTNTTTYKTGNLSSNLEDSKLHSIRFVGDGSTITCYIDGNVTTLDSTLLVPGGTIDSEYNLGIGSGDRAGAHNHIGKIGLVKIINNNAQEIVNWNFSEVSGHTAYNIAVNRPATSNLTFELNGSAVESQWGLSDSQRPKNLLEGYSYHDNISVSSGLIRNQATNYTYTYQGINTDGYQWWKITTIGTGYSGAYWARAGAANAGLGNDYNYKAVFKYQSLGVWMTTPRLSSNNADVIITTNGTIHTAKWKFLNLGTSTSQFITGWAGSAFNVDDEFVLISIERTQNVPANPLVFNKDIEGNALTHLAKFNAKIETENTYDRNPENVLALTNVNVLQGENVTYNSIINNTTQFFDVQDNNIFNTLVYSDFSEPMAGSIFNFYPMYLTNTALAVSIGTAAFTAEFVFKADTFVGSNNTIFSLGEKTSSGLKIRVDQNDKLTIISNGVIRSFTTVLVTGVWYYAKINVGGGTWTLTRLDTNVTESVSKGGVGWSLQNNEVVIGNRASISSQIQKFDGQLQYFKLTRNSGSLKLLHYVFSEEKGLMVYNIAKNRPANSDMNVVLSGAADGTQWILNANTTYQHNLRYGHGTDIYLTELLVDNLTFTETSSSTWQVIKGVTPFILTPRKQGTWKLVMKLANVGNTSGISDIAIVINSQYLIFNNYISNGQTKSIIITMNNGDATSYQIRQRSGTASNAVTISSITMFKTDGKIPGDPNNPGKDVLNNTQANFSESNTYRKVNNFIRRDK